MTEEMTPSELATNVAGFLEKQQRRFVELNADCINKLDFAKECEFAKQQLMKNNYTLDAARGNPDSLIAAISNVAAIGITLNPALAYAYLVPRKINKKLAICLDISYRGLIKLATDTGRTNALKAELVYENDTFVYHGFHKEPEFQADPFGDRGKLKGVYALALTDTGPLVEVMTIGEVYKIRDDSEAYKSVKKEGKCSWQYINNIWVKYEGEMVKKTVIKRAWKTLPPARGTELLGKAIEVLNEHEGIDFKAEPESAHYTEEEREEYRRCFEEEDYFNLVPLRAAIGPDGFLQLDRLYWPKAERGKKGAVSQAVRDNLAEAEKKLETAVTLLDEAFSEGSDSMAMEILEECSKWTKEYLKSKLIPENQQYMEELAS